LIDYIGKGADKLKLIDVSDNELTNEHFVRLRSVLYFNFALVDSFECRHRMQHRQRLNLVGLKLQS